MDRSMVTNSSPSVPLPLRAVSMPGPALAWMRQTDCPQSEWFLLVYWSLQLKRWPPEPRSLPWRARCLAATTRLLPTLWKTSLSASNAHEPDIPGWRRRQPESLRYSCPGICTPWTFPIGP